MWYGKRHELPAHRLAEVYVDAYLAAAGLREDRKGRLFRALDRWSNYIRRVD
jgi:hypothetical protein